MVEEEEEEEEGGMESATERRLTTAEVDPADPAAEWGGVGPGGGGVDVVLHHSGSF